MFLNTVMATGTCMPTEQVHKMSIHNPPSIICTCMLQNGRPDPCLRSVMRSMGKDTPGLLMPTGITSPSLTLASICMACTSVNERYHKLRLQQMWFLKIQAHTVFPNRATVSACDVSRGNHSTPYQCLQM